MRRQHYINNIKNKDKPRTFIRVHPVFTRNGFYDKEYQRLKDNLPFNASEYQNEHQLSAERIHAHILEVGPEALNAVLMIIDSNIRNPALQELLTRHPSVLEHVPLEENIENAMFIEQLHKKHPEVEKYKKCNASMTNSGDVIVFGITRNGDLFSRLNICVD